MAKKNTAPEEDIFDLTELIEEGAKAPKAGAAAYARAAAQASAPDDDFGSVLAQATGGEKQAGKEPERPVNPDEQLDLSDLNDIDNILESLDIPPQPARAAQAPKDTGPKQATSPENLEEDLDNVLDMLGGAEEDKPAKPGTRESSGMDSLDADLDSILDSFDSKPDAKAVKEEKKASSAAAVDDLDSLFDSVDEETAKPAQVKNAQKPAGAAEEIDLDADLDAILGDVAAKPASGEASAVQPEKTAAPLADAEDFDLPDNINDVLEENRPNAQEPASREEDSRELAHIASANTPIPQSTATVVEPGLSQDAVANICQGMLATHMGSFQDSLQKLSLETGSQTARLEDLSRTVTDISRRLFATESKLAAARTKIAALEKTVAAKNGLEDLFREGTDLNSGFMQLLASSVANTVQGLMTAIQENGVQPVQVQALAHAQEDVDGRLVQLESRLDQLEPALTARMDVVETTSARLAGKLESADSSGKQSVDEKFEERLTALEGADHTLSETVDSLQKQLDDLAPQMIERLDQIEAQNAASKASSDARLAESASVADLEKVEQRLENMEKAFNDKISDLASSAQSASANDNSEALQGLEQEIAGVQAKLASLEPDLSSRINDMEKHTHSRLDELDRKLESASTGTELAALAERLDKLETGLNARITEMNEAVQKASAHNNSDDLLNLGEKLAGLEAKFASLEPDISTRMEELKKQASARLDDLAARMEKDSSGKELAALTGRVEIFERKMNEKIAELEQLAQGAASKDYSAVIQNLEQKFTEVENKLAAMEPDLATRIGQMEAQTAERLKEMATKLEKAPKARALSALSEKLDSFETAIDGRMAALEQLSRSSTGSEGLEEIAELEDRFNELRAEFEKLGTNFAARIEMAETQTSELMSRLDHLAMSESPSGLEELTARIDANEKSSMEAENKLAKLSSAEQSVNARVDSLEIRLDKLEPNFNIQIEKAATATVARILNEEIKKLAANG